LTRFLNNSFFNKLFSFLSNTEKSWARCSSETTFVKTISPVTVTLWFLDFFYLFIFWSLSSRKKTSNLFEIGL
jgi:hypothetical protein